MLNYSDLIGIPYVKGGRDPSKGLDCYGLCIVVFKRLGIDLPEFHSPDESDIIHEVIFTAKRQFERFENPIPYSLVPFIIRPPFVTHIGVVLENRDNFIHILRKKCCVIERLSDPFWNKRIQGFYTWGSNGTTVSDYKM